MDVGHTNGWQMQHVVPSRELADRINAEFPIEPAQPNYPGEVAERWRYKDDLTHICFFADASFRWLAGALGADLEFIGRDVVLLRRGLPAYTGWSDNMEQFR